MNLEKKTPHDSLSVHTEKKIKCRRDGSGGCIHIISETEDRMYI
jgi:hypothetical protein